MSLELRSERASVSNDTAGWAKLVEQLRGFSIGAIGLEASEGYERGVMRSLLAAGISVRQVNPLKLRQFARASGVLAKNDPLDARMIASFVAIMPTRPAQRLAPAAERLVEMLAVRRQLSAEKIAAENASRLLEDAMLRRLSRRRIGRLAADIDLLDKRMVEIVATDDALVHRYRLLCSMPGVGPLLACTLIALCGKCGKDRAASDPLDIRKATLAPLSWPGPAMAFGSMNILKRTARSSTATPASSVLKAS